MNSTSLFPVRYEVGHFLKATRVSLKLNLSTLPFLAIVFTKPSFVERLINEHDFGNQPVITS